MHPQKEDDYESEAVEIICLRTTPPFMILALGDGILSHCILMWHQREEQGEEDDDEDDAVYR